jgi:hypothetical protein
MLSGCSLIDSSSTSSTNSSSSSTSSSSLVSSSNSSYDNGTIEAMKEAIAQYQNITDVEMNYTKTQRDSYYSSIFNVNFIAKRVEDKFFMYKYVSYPSLQQSQYYIDNCYYSENFSGFKVEQKDNYDIYNENPLKLDLSLDKYKLFNYSINGDWDVYYVSMNGMEIAPYIKTILGESVTGTDLELSLEVRVLRTTKKLGLITIYIKIVSDQTVNYKIEVMINATGDQVKFSMPSRVIDRISRYKARTNLYTEQPVETEPTSYSDTVDGLVKYYDFVSYKKIVFDEQTNQLVILYNDTIKLYDASTLEYIRSLTPTSVPTNIDADKGRLIVAYKKNYFDIFDLTKVTNPVSIMTNVKVEEIAIDQDILTYAYNDSFCEIIQYNLATYEKMIIKQSMYSPRFTLNRADHILYVTEKGLSTSSVIYFDSQTGAELFRTSKYHYTRDRLLFDGSYVHHDEHTLNRIDGSIHSFDLMNDKYNSFDGFTPTRTVYDKGEIVLIGSSQYKIGVYDKTKYNFIYQFSFNGNQAIALKDNKILLIDNKLKYVAIVNVGSINDDMVDDVPLAPVIDKLDTSNDGKVNTLTTSFYTKSVVDNKYIYTIDEQTYELNIYDLKTLEKVYTESMLIQPISIDVSDGKLVIGFGEAWCFRIYNTSTFEYETINVSAPVYSTIIYNDEIIYSGIDQQCTIRVYNLTTKKVSLFGYEGYYVSMAIDRKNEVLYIGDRNSTSDYIVSFDLKTKKRINSSHVTVSKYEVQFDGNFIHYADYIYDKDLIYITRGNLARTYSSDSIMQYKTIYDDGETSIYVALSSSGEIVTVVHDIATDRDTYSIEGNSSHAYKVDNSFVILHNDLNYIQRLTLH